jgi:putative acetyltransferase
MLPGRTHSTGEHLYFQTMKKSCARVQRSDHPFAIWENKTMDRFFLQLDPRDFEALDLLGAHFAFCQEHTPQDFVCALDTTAFLEADLSLFGVRGHGTVVAIGAIRELSSVEGEFKSIHTRNDCRGTGAGTLLLEGLLAECRRRGYHRVNLETGTTPGFAPARRLYARMGFVDCPPFGSYHNTAHNQCMTLDITAVHTERPN